MDTSNVDTVIVGGDIVKSHGRLHHDDVEETLNEVTKSAQRLFSRSR